MGVVLPAQVDKQVLEALVLQRKVGVGGVVTGWVRGDHGTSAARERAAGVDPLDDDHREPLQRLLREPKPAFTDDGRGLAHPCVLIIERHAEVQYAADCLLVHRRHREEGDNHRSRRTQLRSKRWTNMPSQMMMMSH